MSASATPRRVLVLGGTSEIGLAIVRRLAVDGAVTPVLVGRDRERLDAAAQALGTVGIGPAEIELADADDLDAHAPALEAVFARGPVDIAVLALGVLGGQDGLATPHEEALEVLRVNVVGAGSLLLHTLRRLEAQGRGTLIVLSSVAAERPRASNPIYGAAKAGLDSLAQGLADATAGSGVRVLTVRPGFVTTRMTEGLEPAPFSTTPQAVAEATVAALDGSAHTVWVPGLLRWLFAVLRHLPRPIFRRLPL